MSDPIPPAEIAVRTSRSSGPGGQHANTSDTRVEATWDVESSEALTEQQRERVIARLGPVVRAVAEDTRSQSRNRELAIARLQAKVASALVVARPRRPSRPSRSAVERRLAGKRRQSLRKQQRRMRPDRDDE